MLGQPMVYPYTHLACPHTPSTESIYTVNPSLAENGCLTPPTSPATLFPSHTQIRGSFPPTTEICRVVEEL